MFYVSSILSKTIRDYRGYIGIVIEKMQQELNEMIDDIDCFTLSLRMQDADNSYYGALEEKDEIRKKMLLEQALSSCEEALQLGADYVIDLIFNFRKY